VKKKRSGAILVAFHYQHEGRWLCWTIGTRESRLSFLVYDQWQKGNIIDSTIIDYASDPEEWIQIKVFVDGLEVKAYINDIPRLNVSLPRGFLSKWKKIGKSGKIFLLIKLLENLSNGIS
jgi:hypothetical protein